MTRRQEQFLTSVEDTATDKDLWPPAERVGPPLLTPDQACPEHHLKAGPGARNSCLST